MRPISRRRSAALCLAFLAPILAQCGREERTLSLYGDLAVERNGDLAALTVEGRLHDAMLPAAEFEQAWSVLTREATPYEGLALTLHGGSPTDPAGVAVLSGLVIVLPTPLRAGARYPIGRALAAPESGMPMYWSFWGGRDLREAGSAEVALRVFDYHTVGMRVERDFIATAASGSIEVLQRGRDWADLRLDLMATDAAGDVVRVRGDVSFRAERYTPPG